MCEHRRAHAAHPRTRGQQGTLSTALQKHFLRIGAPTCLAHAPLRRVAILMDIPHGDIVDSEPGLQWHTHTLLCQWRPNATVDTPQSMRRNAHAHKHADRKSLPDKEFRTPLYCRENPLAFTFCRRRSRSSRASSLALWREGSLTKSSHSVSQRVRAARLAYSNIGSSCVPWATSTRCSSCASFLASSAVGSDSGSNGELEAVAADAMCQHADTVRGDRAAGVLAFRSAHLPERARSDRSMRSTCARCHELSRLGGGGRAAGGKLCAGSDIAAAKPALGSPAPCAHTTATAMAESGNRAPRGIVPPTRIGTHDVPGWTVGTPERERDHY